MTQTRVGILKGEIMKRALVLLLMVMIIRTVWCIEYTDTLLYAVENRAVADAEVHVRCQGKHWALLWDYIDDQNYKLAELKRGSADFENDLKYATTLTLSEMQGGIVRSSLARRIYHIDKSASIRLMTNGNVTHIYAGDGEPVDQDNDYAFDGITGSKILLRQIKPMKIEATNVNVGYQVALDSDIDKNTTLQHVSNSTDSLEGVWEYMERDMPSAAVRLGGFYTLLIVRTGGDYTIHYLNGAKNYAQLWEEVQPKGRLIRTPFVGHYDLEWVDAKRTMLMKGEMWANLESDNSVLALHFPVLKTIIKFRKLSSK